VLAAAVATGLSAVPGASADTCTITVTSSFTGSVLATYVQVPVPASEEGSQSGLVSALVGSGAVPAGSIDLNLVTLADNCTPDTSTSTTTTTTTTTTTSPPPATNPTNPTNPTDPTAPPTTTSPLAPPTSPTAPPLTGPTVPPTTTSTTTSGSTTTSTTSPTTTSTTKTTTTGTTTTTSTTSTTARPGSSRDERASSRPGTISKNASKRHRSRKAHRRRRHRAKTAPIVKLPSGKGVPTDRNPTFSLSLPGAPPVGVPNFFIDSFQIPPFLLPIYQAAGIEYQVPWQILASINEIETDYGRNLSVSSAGAVGWMQFEPSTWAKWGMDANGDGVADPYNPVDAIFSAARYLHAAGASQNLSRAIFAYNHAEWYVQSVLLRAKLIGGMPSQLIGALTGLVQGHFPVAAPAKYADDNVVALSRRKVTTANAAEAIESDPHAKATRIFARRNAPVIAVNDGKIVKLGQSRALGKYVELQDQTGNIYTYSHLGTISKTFAAPKPVQITPKDIASELATPKVKPPTQAASAGTQRTPRRLTAAEVNAALTVENRKAVASTVHAPAATHRPAVKTAARKTATTKAAAPLLKERLFAHPARKASFAAGGNLQLRHADRPIASFDNYFADTLHLARGQYTVKRLKVGSIVIGGTILGRIGAKSPNVASHIGFAIQPAGKGAPEIDPKPILDGWKLLQATAVYRANRIDPFYGPGKKNPSVGQVLLMSKQQLTGRVLTDPHVLIYNCGRRDIQAGVIDRRVLAVIEFLSASGLDPTVTGLACGAGANGATGVDKAGATGESVDISKINGIPIAGHQGPGSITDITIRRLLTLQGSMAPDDIVSDMSYKGQGTTLALPDHKNRIQVSYSTAFGKGRLGSAPKAVLTPQQWTKLINRISEIPEPVVPISPSKYAIRDPRHR
jgi:Transglycosylase SLT domain/Peptidase family M23